MQCTLQAITWPSTSTLPTLYQTGTCRHPYLTRYIIRYDSHDYGAAVLSDQRPSLPAHGTRTQEEPTVLGENPGWRGRGVLMSSFAAAAPPIGRETWGPGSGDAAGFRHATLNVNGLNEGKLDKILIWMMKDSIDSLTLIDVRGSNAALPYWKETIRRCLGPASKVYHALAVPFKFKAGQPKQVRVGGLLHIIGSRWGRRSSNFYQDPSGLGLVSAVDVKLQGSYRVPGPGIRHAQRVRRGDDRETNDIPSSQAPRCAGPAFWRSECQPADVIPLDEDMGMDLAAA